MPDAAGNYHCRHCDAWKPGTEFYTEKGRIKGWCKACKRAYFDHPDRRKPKPARLAGSLLPGQAGRSAPDPLSLSFRGVLEEVARPEWRTLAKKLVAMAKEGDKAALKLVVEQLIGHPTPARDDSGPERFWLRVLAAADAADRGDAVLADPPGDLGDDRPPPDAGTVDGPRGE